MTNRPWPTREEWAAQAENAERTRILPTERVSRLAADYLNEHELQTLAEALTAAWKALGRQLRCANDDDRPAIRSSRRTLNRARRALAGQPDVFDLAHTRVVLEHVGIPAAETARELIHACDARWRTAGKEAESEAVAAEIARRQTGEAWDRELRRRARYENRGLIYHRAGAA